ncbi:flagellar basal body rod protein FlgB [Kaarinaea lacus]
MRFDLDQIFGVHQQGVRIRSKRAELLANNMANADTPGFKARDVDFKQALQQAQAGMSSSLLKTTNAKHMSSGAVWENNSSELLYRNPIQPSVDGNTVDSQYEKSQFVQNAIQYQTSLNFLSGKIKSLMTAIKGE